MSTKKLLIYIVSFVIAGTLVVAAYYGFRGKSTTEVSNPELFAEYITAYTAGMVSKNTIVTVKFTESAIENIDTAKIKASEILKIDPSVEGTFYWADKQTIEFRPATSLPSGTKFTAEVLLHKMMEIPEELEIFTFRFYTIKQNIKVDVTEVVTLDEKNYGFQKVIGTLTLADEEDTAAVQKTVSATFGGKNIGLKWESAGPKIFTFTADSIKRTDAASELFFKWNGDEIDVDKSGDISVEIPALNTFKVLWFKVLNSPEQTVIIQFSDPIDPAQDLSGLIAIGNESGIKTTIKNNCIYVYPSTLLEGTYTVTAFQGIANTVGSKLEKDYVFSSSFENIKPQVKLTSKGVILPSSENGLLIPFEAVGLREVDVRIIRIFENNITQFMQVNEFDGNSELARVGKIVSEQSIALDEDPNVDLEKWNRYFLNLNEIIKVEPGAIYRVSIGFRQFQAIYPCVAAENAEGENGEEGEVTEEVMDPKEVPISKSFEYFGSYYYDEYYDYEYDYYYGEDYYNYWDNRDNPCHRAYYGSQRCVSQNIFATNIGLIAKKGSNGTLIVVATDLLSAKPLSGVEIEIFDYTKQTLGRSTTNSEGLAVFNDLEEPFLVKASSGKQSSYLKITGGLSLSLSSFDVGGESVQDGMKGFIYGERGVWRPGDTIFLTFILDENGVKLPENHPVILEFRNPSNQMVKRITRAKTKNGFYRFDLLTSDSDPTGNWEVRIIVGGATFYKNLKIETIRPNRLKIRLEFPQEQFYSGISQTGTMSALWLHGAPARNMNAQIDAMLSSITTTFPNYKEYTFDDPGKKYTPSLVEVFNGKLDDNGVSKVTPAFDLNVSDISGFLNAVFITKVFESSGNFSIDQFKFTYSPYLTYLGIKLPEPEKGQYYQYTDTNLVVDIVSVSQNGKADNRTIEVEATIYKLDWKWWWSQDDYSYNYNAHSYMKPYKTEKIKLINGKGKFPFRINYPDWGRFLIRIEDKEGGHSTGFVKYFDWPGYRSRENRGYSETSTMLSFTTDKTEYLTGEKVVVTIPSSKGGHAFVSLENGKGVVKSFWVETKDEQTEFSFVAEPEMAPNVYINITLLQPHAQTLNDLPIRLYGIMPVKIENPESHLFPEISMPDKLRSESSVTIKVNEKNKKAMTYTLAVVDEGLLDLTRFKTPNPWDYFYAREALGVLTWDIFDMVIGAFGQELEHILAIGGDESSEGDKNKKANRFKPMVVFIGPFDLAAGKTNSHTIQIPNYIGSVRTMVIAGNKNSAYGFADKTTPVTKPLAVITEMPRLLSPGDKIKLPVTIFAFEPKIKNANVQIVTNKLLKVEGGNQKSVTFGKYNEQDVEFSLSTTSETGIATVEVIATSGSEKSTYKIELEVRYPNTPMTDVYSQVAESGTEVTLNLAPFGLPGTNKATLEISSIPPLNLEKRHKYLIQYPHGCVEQTTSSAFPQLYLANLIQISEQGKQDIDRNIKAAIDKLMKFQTYTGGMSYWPGNSNSDGWSTSYSGHFLIEAKKKGYNVPESFMKKWLKYQQTTSRNWVDDGPSSQMTQAYRLYTLALYGKPESGAMNRLKENRNLNLIARWQLAAAYAVNGKSKVASDLIGNLETKVNPYKELYYTYGSDLRDEAIILETLNRIGNRKLAMKVIQQMSDKLSTNYWYSTQSTAWALMSISSFFGNDVSNGKIAAQYKLGTAGYSNVSSEKPLFLQPLNAGDKPTTLTIKNNGKSPLFVRLIAEGIPAPGNETDAENGLRLNVSYATPDGESIEIENLQQGTDMLITVNITNPTVKYYYNMTLNHLLPTGFEILNTRMMEIEGPKEDYFTYQDVRDNHNPNTPNTLTSICTVILLRHSK